MAAPRKCNHDEIIELKRQQPYIPATKAVEVLNLPITDASVRQIWLRAKKRGEL